jgi:acetyl-CoA carboxylase biotin carboxylase subunit
VLIANRGEIALRVARSCRQLDVQSVIIYSEADRGAPWLEHADQTVCVGGARAAGSYLNADAVLQAAEQTECQAVHPGYGFLAENAVFSARCEQQGLTFIGPSAAAIRRMGDKFEAKRTMARAGLPIIPGSDTMLDTVEQARRQADEIGYPVLLKAVAGGGGKGMRTCADAAALAQAFSEARLEAEKAFGNPMLYLEKFIDEARHVEFQILVDNFGGSVHLGERECSIQRKHQKLLEEAPSPVVDDATRERLGESVAQAVARFGYRNAGTVEFLRDPAGNFFFMEMNTRLQVEHPVTEMVTGVDLVAQQLKLAANEPLELDQADLRLQGHAIEFRINAEDPDNDFRPDPGVIRAVDIPPGKLDGLTVRWDSAIEAGYRIPPYYDSMVGKLIVHGARRAETLGGAAGALASLKLDGVRTTIPLHLRLLEDGNFRDGRYDINYLARSGLLTRPAES